MKYNIQINQKAVVDNGWDLDVIDMSILNYIQDFINSDKIIKAFIDGEQYFWIYYEHFITEMPLLGIKNKQSLKRRIDKLVESGILRKKLLNNNSTFFKFGKNYELLVSDTNLKEEGVGKVEGGEYTELKGGSMKSGSVEHYTNDYYTNENNILSKDNTAEKENNQNSNLDKGITSLEKEKSSAKKESYGDPEINELIQMFKNINDGMIDGTQKEQRNYGKHLLNKLKQLNSVKDGVYTWQYVLDVILKKISENSYHSHKICGPKKTYYHITELMNIIRGELNKEQTKANKVVNLDN